ncbi:MAG: hypothetical protein AAFR56_07230 [Chloroflexota bacterium]
MRTLSFVDILRARRLTEAGTVLDTQIRCTSTDNGLNSALLSSMMPLTGHHTLMARAGKQRVVGQFYIPQDASIAKLVYLAPGRTADVPDDAWLLVLDGIVAEAGKRGAHVLVGEVDENSLLFETMRQSNFAVYARQRLWAALPISIAPPGNRAQVERATEDDTGAIYALYRRTVPRLLQQVSVPPSMNGFVYRESGRMMGFINVVEGRDGVLFTPYIDPNVLSVVDDIFASAASQLAGQRLVTVRVTRHQGWLGSSLEAIGFGCAAEQAVMVRHIAAGVHSPGFANLEEKYAAQAAKRQTGELPEMCADLGGAPQKHSTDDDSWPSAPAGTGGR